MGEGGGDCWHYLCLYINLGEAPMKPGECYLSNLKVSIAMPLYSEGLLFL